MKLNKNALFHSLQYAILTEHFKGNLQFDWPECIDFMDFHDWMNDNSCDYCEDIIDNDSVLKSDMCCSKCHNQQHCFKCKIKQNWMHELYTCSNCDNYGCEYDCYKCRVCEKIVCRECNNKFEILRDYGDGRGPFYACKDHDIR